MPRVAAWECLGSHSGMQEVCDPTVGLALQSCFETEGTSTLQVGEGCCCCGFCLWLPRSVGLASVKQDARLGGTRGS